MAGVVPIMCAAALSLLYSGEVTSVDQQQVSQALMFPTEVPNYGFIASFRPEVWETGITFKGDGNFPWGSSYTLLRESGPARWQKGKRVIIQIMACEDDGMLSALQNWNALAPPMR